MTETAELELHELDETIADWKSVRDACDEEFREEETLEIGLHGHASNELIDLRRSFADWSERPMRFRLDLGQRGNTGRLFTLRDMWYTLKIDFFSGSINDLYRSMWASVQAYESLRNPVMKCMGLIDDCRYQKLAPTLTRHGHRPI